MNFFSVALSASIAVLFAALATVALFEGNHTTSFIAALGFVLSFAVTLDHIYA